jgi:hypothetical protein
MSQTATRIDYQPELIGRSVAEQLALNRSVVAAAEDQRLEEAIHPTRWERRGLLGMLRRRPGLSQIR